MSLREDILRSACEWITECASLEDGQVIFSQRDKKTIRPPRGESWIEISLNDVDQPIGSNEISFDGITLRRRGVREGTLAVRGYGSESLDWLVLLGFHYSCANTIFSFSRDLGVLDLSGMGDSQAGLQNDVIESRYLREFRISYAVTFENTSPSLVCVDDIKLEGTYPATYAWDPALEDIDGDDLINLNGDVLVGI